MEIVRAFVKALIESGLALDNYTIQSRSFGYMVRFWRVVGESEYWFNMPFYNGWISSLPFTTNFVNWYAAQVEAGIKAKMEIETNRVLAFLEN